VLAALPDSPGVYFFKGRNNDIMYVGKATSLRDRVRSYFAADIVRGRGPLIQKLLADFATIDYVRTDSVLEALLLEANLIKKHQPPYNSREKDNKSFNYVIFSRDAFPKLQIVRGRTIAATFPKEEIKYIFGPFPHGMQLKEAMTIIRKIFPFTDAKCVPAADQIARGKTPRPCFNRQIGLCPGVCTGEISQREYAQTIQNLRLFFEGKKGTLLRNLEKQMKAYAKAREFEKADRVKRTIFALTHIRDVSLLKREQWSPGTASDTFRIEAYDIAHLQGSDMVGVMVAVEDGEVAKSEYRKFKIKLNKGINDISALKEVLRRRLGHAEWRLPNLIVVDGAQAQINAAHETLAERGFSIDVVSVVKDERHKAREILGEKRHALAHGAGILLANSEAHRFAIGYHRHRRSRRIV
jgi:excinuclease ABC subunit C